MISVITIIILNYSVITVPWVMKSSITHAQYLVEMAWFFPYKNVMTKLLNQNNLNGFLKIAEGYVQLKDEGIEGGIHEAVQNERDKALIQLLLLPVTELTVVSSTLGVLFAISSSRLAKCSRARAGTLNSRIM